MDDDKEIADVINKLVGIIKYHKIENASELKKYIYTHNYSEKTMKQMKDIFVKYGEINVFNCVLLYYINKKENTEENLIKKIKGII